MTGLDAGGRPLDTQGLHRDGDQNLSRVYHCAGLEQRKGWRHVNYDRLISLLMWCEHLLKRDFAKGLRGDDILGLLCLPVTADHIQVFTRVDDAVFKRHLGHEEVVEMEFRLQSEDGCRAAPKDEKCALRATLLYLNPRIVVLNFENYVLKNKNCRSGQAALACGLRVPMRPNGEESRSRRYNGQNGSLVSRNSCSSRERDIPVRG